MTPSGLHTMDTRTLDPTKVKKLGAGNYSRVVRRLEDDKDWETVHMFGKSARRNSNHSQHEMNLRMLNDQLDNSLFAEAL